MSLKTSTRRIELPQSKKEWLVAAKIAVAAASFLLVYAVVPNAVPAAVGAACSITHTVAGLPEFKRAKRAVSIVIVHGVCAAIVGTFLVLTYQFVPLIPDALGEVRLYWVTLAGVALSCLTYFLTLWLDPAQ
jgi:hypothetical protein